ncbi:hypothetical protein [Acidocella facilis]|uniref:hypothetical protein n=1 Tax=Acidocella facilis TaxID=525 RepID=UPI001F1CD779|nr:hypothetical protein [Acidocella facilis]
MKKTATSVSPIKISPKPVTPARKRVPKKIPLKGILSTKEARERFSEIVAAAQSRGTSTKITANGDVVAVLGPVSSLPKGVAAAKQATITDFTKATPPKKTLTFRGVVHDCPYTVMSKGKEAAVLYYPGLVKEAQLEKIIEILLELQLLDNQKAEFLQRIEIEKAEALESLRNVRSMVEEGTKLARAEADQKSREIAEQMERRLNARLKGDELIRRRIQLLKDRAFFSEAEDLEKALKNIDAEDSA